MIDENVRSISPTGLALAILLVSIICLAISVLAVGLRVHLRLADDVFGIDDALIIAGLVVYTVDVVLACHGVTVGLGTWDAELNAWLSVEGKKYLMLWMMVYIIGLATIKTSVCATLYRIASHNKVYRISVFVLLGLTIATMFVTLIGVLLLCKPVSGNWTGEGECASMRSMVALSYTSTASTILTDLALAVLPGVMVLQTIMNIRKKIAVMALLSFASVASVTTVLRIPYIDHYWTPLDNLNYWTGYIVLLSNIESAIGCIASSLPALPKLKNKKSGETPVPSTPRHSHKSLVTFGSLPARNTPFRSPTGQGANFSTVRGGDWTRIGDGGESDATVTCDHGEEPDFDGIRTEHSYQVELQHLGSKY